MGSRGTYGGELEDKDSC